MEYYYHPDLLTDHITLSLEESKHCVKVMHHRIGDTIQIVDGVGCLAKAEVISYDKQYCYVSISERSYLFGKRDFSLHIGVSPTKNRDRMEWLLEKAVEVGIEKISFMMCTRSERARLDLLRLKRIAISAMKQSQTAYIPEIEMISFEEMIEGANNTNANKMIAWCEAENDTEELAHISLEYQNSILLIGPEGDFTPQEVELARQLNFREVKLGAKRLRTETAAFYGCCVINSRML